MYLDVREIPYWTAVSILVKLLLIIHSLVYLSQKRVGEVAGFKDIRSQLAKCREKNGGGECWNGLVRLQWPLAWSSGPQQVSERVDIRRRPPTKAPSRSQASTDWLRPAACQATSHPVLGSTRATCT